MVRNFNKPISDEVFEEFEGSPEARAVVLVALPDLRDERCIGSEGLEFPAEHSPVDVTVKNLKAFAVDSRSIGDVEVADMGPHDADELTE